MTHGVFQALAIEVVGELAITKDDTGGTGIRATTTGKLVEGIGTDTADLLMTTVKIAVKMEIGRTTVGDATDIVGLLMTRMKILMTTVTMTLTMVVFMESWIKVLRVGEAREEVLVGNYPQDQ